MFNDFNVGLEDSLPNRRPGFVHRVGSNESKIISECYIGRKGPLPNHRPGFVHCPIFACPKAAVVLNIIEREHYPIIAVVWCTVHFFFA